MDENKVWHNPRLSVSDSGSSRRHTSRDTGRSDTSFTSVVFGDARPTATIRLSSQERKQRTHNTIITLSGCGFVAGVVLTIIDLIGR